MDENLGNYEPTTPLRCLCQLFCHSDESPMHYTSSFLERWVGRGENIVFACDRRPYLTLPSIPLISSKMLGWDPSLGSLLGYYFLVFSVTKKKL
jgi:hypothetical protein